jgi:hypothetical protein
VDSANHELGETERSFIPAISYIRLHNLLKYYRRTLDDVSENGDIAYIAWLARNILELKVWVHYCSASTENVQEFSDDAVRDLVDLNKTNDAIDSEHRAQIDELASMIEQDKATTKYKRVSDAAKDCKIAGYEEAFKTLSKFAHPTAMTIFAPSKSTLLRSLIVDSAKITADDALKILDSSFLARSYQDSEKFLLNFNSTKVPSDRLELE